MRIGMFVNSVSTTQENGGTYIISGGVFLSFACRTPISYNVSSTTRQLSLAARPQV